MPNIVSVMVTILWQLSPGPIITSGRWSRLAGHLPGLSPNYRHYAGTLPTATPANTFYSQHYYLDGEHFTSDDVTHCHHYYVYFRCSNVGNGSPHLNTTQD